MSIVVARSLGEVLDHLSSATDVTLLAGGTDLMVDLNFGRKRPGRVVALDRVPEMAHLERNGRVHAALAALGTAERKLLLLAFFEGMSHQEIADHTGMPLGSVKTVVRRGLMTLRASLGLNDSAGAPE